MEMYMKNKKKAGMMLAAALSLSGAVTVFGSDGTVVENGGQASCDVTGSYVTGEDGGTVYRVDITWGAMEFTYTDVSKDGWDTGTHQYNSVVPAAWSWTDDTNKITVTNHSNTAVDASLAYQNNPGYDITADFYNASISGDSLPGSKLEIASAEPEDGNVQGSAKSGDAYLQITGGSITEEDSGQTLGTVTVTISDQAEP